jgi:mono/diheme cytochrome c family protein
MEEITMKMITKYRARILFTISALLLAVSLPTWVFATHFPEPGDPVAGAKVWAENCSRCHNARDPADLRDDQWISTAFHMRMRAGLTGQQTRDVLTFMQDSNVAIVIEPLVFEGGPSSQATEAASAASTLSGSEVYAQTCIACHGDNGKGTVPGAPDFTRSNSPLTQSDEILFKNVKRGFKSKGSPMAMPPKGGNMSLTDSDVRAVVEYLQETFGQ